MVKLIRDDGLSAFAELAIDAPLDRLGLKGGRLKLYGLLQRTRVEDPISGETRNFTGYYPDWEWSAEFRRDVGKFAYGLTISDRDRFSFFRSNEIDSNYNGGIYGNAFVEYRPGARTTVTADINNAFNTRGLRGRSFTFPNRSLPGPTLDEFRERNQHVNFALTLKRSFGGAGKTAAAVGAESAS